MYQIEYHPLVASQDIPALPKTVKKRIRAAIEQRLAVDPIHYGRPLRYSLKGHRRLRVGDWRVVYRVSQKSQRVTVLIICHRKEVYSSSTR